MWCRQQTVVGRMLTGATVALMGTGCGQIEPGQIQGDIRYDPAPQEVLDYLAANPSQGGGTVVVTDTADPSQTASVFYTVAGGTAPPDVGQYTINPDVDADGATFALRVIDVRFANGARYRFGPAEPTSPGAHITPVVLPLNQDSDGVTFDLVECGALVQVPVRLTGAAQDLNALDELVICTAVAAVQENPGSPAFTEQAVSAAVVTTLSTLRDEGVQIPILVRTGRPVGFAVGCVCTTSQPGFPQDPSLPAGTVVFVGAGDPITVACGTGTQPAIEIEVEVERTAGGLRGLLDVVDHVESRLDISLQPSGFVFPLTIASAAVPPHAWEFEAVPSGPHQVTARTLLDNGSSLLTFPKLQGPESVQVAEGGTTDLNARFVVLPFTLHSQVSLRDPLPGTKLTELALNPFTSLGTPSTSFIRAKGLDGFFVDSQGQVGANGIGAESSARFNGAFDAAAGRADLTADLLLVGLSPVNGSLTGQGTLPANWSVDSISVRLNDPDVFEQTSAIGTNLSIPFASLPGGEGNFVPMDVCFGEFSLTLQSPTGFTISRPRLSISSATVQQLADDDGQLLRYDTVSGDSRAAPFQDSAATEDVTVVIALPAYVRYQLRPSINLRNDSSGQVTSATLPTLSVPPNGMIQCGESIPICAQLDDEGEIVSQLTVQVQSAFASCDPNDVQLDVFAESTGGVLLSVEIQVGSQPAVQICGGAQPCSNPLIVEHPVGALTPGDHVVTVRAEDSLGCEVEAERLVRVFERPALTCPDPIVTQLRADETTVPFDRVDEQLQASWSGGCPGSALPPILDDHPAEFPRGSTTVRFHSEPNDTPAGEQECETTVLVLPPNDCNTFGTLDLGALPQTWTIGEVEYRLLDQPPARVIDQFPVQQPDGEPELLLASVEIELPFAAEWIRIQYVKASSLPLLVEGFDDDGQLVQTWESPAGGPDGDPERQRLTRAVVGPPKRTLRLSAQGGEVLITRICYDRDAPPGPQPGDVIVVPSP